MAVSRDKNRNIVNNTAYPYLHSNIFRNRKRNSILHFGTTNLKYPTTEEISRLTLERVLWKTGSKYYNIANEYYDDPEYWWVISFFNLKPLETDNRPGDIILVPTPLTNVLRYMGYNT